MKNANQLVPIHIFVSKIQKYKIKKIILGKTKLEDFLNQLLIEGN